MTINGLAGASGTSLPGAATVTVSAGFEVTPPTATCTAGSASVAPEAGSARIVARDVAAGTTATVTVTCTDGSNSATADAEFTARPAPQSGNCSSSLGTLASGTVTVAGSWIAGCESAHLGSPQAPHWAWSFTFAVAGAATVDVDVVSSEDPYLTVTADADGSIAGQDDDSGDDGRDARLRGLQLTRASYTVEVTTAGPSTEGAFTLTLTVTGPRRRPR